MASVAVADLVAVVALAAPDAAVAAVVAVRTAVNGGEMPVSHSFAKRQKELRRQEKQRDKEQKRRDRRAVAEGGAEAGAVDPDIAGIVPGPQPPADGDLPDPSA